MSVRMLVPLLGAAGLSVGILLMCAGVRRAIRETGGPHCGLDEEESRQSYLRDGGWG